MVCQPQPDAEGLEPIVGVQCLEGQEAVSGPVAPGAARPQEQRVQQLPQDYRQALLPVSPIQMFLESPCSSV